MCTVFCTIILNKGLVKSRKVSDTINDKHKVGDENCAMWESAVRAEITVGVLIFFIGGDSSDSR